MTTHWSPGLRQERSGLGPGSGPDHAGRFELAFQRHGERTCVGRQFVSYPFHMTRPFALDAAIPALLTVYQQSSSGGLYRGEQLSSHYDVGARGAAHVTTQAATVVHDCQGQPALHATFIELREGAFLALTPDPLVLFPGASCSNTLEARLANGAVLLVADSFACYDPLERSRPFERLSADVVIRDAACRLLVRDCFEISGDALFETASPMGRWRVASSFLIVGEQSRLPKRADLETVEKIQGTVVGVTALANAAGWGVRCLAANAAVAREIGEALFSACVQAAFGHLPTPRRK